MSEFRVECRPLNDEWTCRVQVSEGRSQSEHEVTVNRAELERLAPGADEPTALVSESFRYLLEREPKESILHRFAISEIERYFPSYPEEIGTRLRG